MDIHNTARLTPYCRGWMVERVLRGRPQTVLAGELGVSVRTVCKWLKRFQAEGPDGLLDRSSRPRNSPRATVRDLGLAMLALRRQRVTLVSTAERLQLTRSTVARICAWAGLTRLARLEPTASCNPRSAAAWRTETPRLFTKFTAYSLNCGLTLRLPI